MARRKHKNKRLRPRGPRNVQNGPEGDETGGVRTMSPGNNRIQPSHSASPFPPHAGKNSNREQTHRGPGPGQGQRRNKQRSTSRDDRNIGRNHDQQSGPGSIRSLRRNDTSVIRDYEHGRGRHPRRKLSWSTEPHVHFERHRHQGQGSQDGRYADPHSEPDHKNRGVSSIDSHYAKSRGNQNDQRHRRDTHGSVSDDTFCSRCQMIKSYNARLRKALLSALGPASEALARWADDVGVGDGSSIEEMEWQPEPTILVKILKEPKNDSPAKHEHGSAVWQGPGLGLTRPGYSEYDPTSGGVDDWNQGRDKGRSYGHQEYDPVTGCAYSKRTRDLADGYEAAPPSTEPTSQPLPTQSLSAMGAIRGPYDVDGRPWAPPSPTRDHAPPGPVYRRDLANSSPCPGYHDLGAHNEPPKVATTTSAHPLASWKNNSPLNKGSQMPTPPPDEMTPPHPDGCLDAIGSSFSLLRRVGYGIPTEGCSSFTSGRGFAGGGFVDEYTAGERLGSPKRISVGGLDEYMNGT